MVPYVTKTQHSLQLLSQLLLQRAFDYQDEALCQQQICEFLTTQGVTFEAEFRLDSSNRIDFYFPISKIGLEIKASKKWSKARVYRQVERYCGFPEIRGLILATGRAQGLPSPVNGKPVRVLHLGVAHL
ncbi:hypothetical protein [Reinekea sp. G2M2-21]|uniref:hypothetical protein n=1 Tax=Reinekea sp. G2M2-21 TaxID=2788942 RepID=UPI0018ABBB48|nr:hypothetical protein [Reinekea sp. G2M2-21]